MLHNMATQSLLAKILATARDTSAAMMRRFLDTGDVACDFDSDDVKFYSRRWGDK